MQKYIVTSKVATQNNVRTTRYYATAISGRKINLLEMARELSENSSLNIADIISVLDGFAITAAAHIEEGNTVHINGIGFLSQVLTSSGHLTPDEVTPDTVQSCGVHFCIEKKFKEKLMENLKVERVFDSIGKTKKG